jgi:hypothetical protein
VLILRTTFSQTAASWATFNGSRPCTEIPAVFNLSLWQAKQYCLRTFSCPGTLCCAEAGENPKTTRKARKEKDLITLNEAQFTLHFSVTGDKTTGGGAANKSNVTPNRRTCKLTTLFRYPPVGLAMRNKQSGLQADMGSVFIVLDEYRSDTILPNMFVGSTE